MSYSNSPTKTCLLSLTMDIELEDLKSPAYSYCKEMCAHRRQVAANVTFFGFVFIIPSHFLYTLIDDP